MAAVKEVSFQYSIRTREIFYPTRNDYVEIIPFLHKIVKRVSVSTASFFFKYVFMPLTTAEIIFSKRETTVPLQQVSRKPILKKDTMKKYSFLLRLLLCTVPVFLFAHAAGVGNGNGPFIVHPVLKGETVSLICIDYYGFYDPGYGTLFMTDNPSLKDINMIYPGQKLRFRNPGYKPGNADSTAPVIVKKVSVRQGVATYVEGYAFLLQKNGAQKKKLSPNTVVFPGDTIQTLANGRVEIIMNRETAVRMRENTKLTIDSLRDNTAAAGKTQIGFSLGVLWTKMKIFSDKVSRFELELPTAIAGVHGTVYESTVNDDSSAEVKVFAGEVAVSNNSLGALNGTTGGVTEVKGVHEIAGPLDVSLEQWVQIVREMQSIKIDKGGKPRKVAAFAKDPDDSWEQWNEQRDSMISGMFDEDAR
jgi:hypothetical protein